jgi:hypothetical protein
VDGRDKPGHDVEGDVSVRLETAPIVSIAACPRRDATA